MSAAARSSPSTDGSSRRSGSPNTTDEGAARRFRVRPDDYRQAEARARARGADAASASTIRIPTSPRGRRSTIWSTPGRIFTYVIISVRAGDAGRHHGRGTCATTGPAFDEGELRWPTGPDSDAATPVHQPAGHRRRGGRHRRRSAVVADHAVLRSEAASLCRRWQAAALRERLRERRRHPVSRA